MCQHWDGIYVSEYLSDPVVELKSVRILSSLLRLFFPLIISPHMFLLGCVAF